MTASGFVVLEGVGRFRSRSREVAADESGALVDRAPVAFGQVVEDGDVVTVVEEKLDADAPDVAGAADDKNFHPRKVRRASPLSKESPPRMDG